MADLALFRRYKGVRREPLLVSVVAPVFCEQETVEPFCKRVAASLDGLAWELVLVDDGSTDGTCQILERLAKDDSRIRVIFLSRNFGHQKALTAGLDRAEGNVVVMMDGDLQDPPELIPDLIERWRAGADVVYAVREQRLGERRFKVVTARWFYRLISKLSDVDLHQDSGD